MAAYRTKKNEFEGKEKEKQERVEKYINPYIAFLEDNGIQPPQALQDLKLTYVENFQRYTV
jgi:hypothetical protein